VNLSRLFSPKGYSSLASSDYSGTALGFGSALGSEFLIFLTDGSLPGSLSSCSGNSCSSSSSHVFSFPSNVSFSSSLSCGSPSTSHSGGSSRSSGSLSAKLLSPTSGSLSFRNKHASTGDYRLSLSSSGGALGSYSLEPGLTASDLSTSHTDKLGAAISLLFSFLCLSSSNTGCFLSAQNCNSAAPS